MWVCSSGLSFIYFDIISPMIAGPCLSPSISNPGISHALFKDGTHPFKGPEACGPSGKQPDATAPSALQLRENPHKTHVIIQNISYIFL